MSPYHGSSPLTRGKRGSCNQAAVFVGLIPAHAGKTMRVRTPAARFRAHPRSRGENPIFALTLKCGCGSSPLTRGKHGRGCDYCWCERLIPAHAGKTGTPAAVDCVTAAHPRSRGENGFKTASRRVLAGSSPLMRGKHHQEAQRADQDRLIPAHAGKTQLRTTRRGNPRAHPRSRGENLGMRPSGHSSGGAHPRSRGENQADPRQPARAGGSSPLTRGKRGQFVAATPAGGLIPAHAGKTQVID